MDTTEIGERVVQRAMLDRGPRDTALRDAATDAAVHGAPDTAGLPTLETVRLGVVGLGYVGLPLAVAFGHRYETVGFDINAQRVTELREGRDSTLEVDAAELAQARRLRCSSDLGMLQRCNVYIVTVPTPIDAAKRPDLTPLIRASEA